MGLAFQFSHKQNRRDGVGVRRSYINMEIMCRASLSGAKKHIIIFPFGCSAAQTVIM